MPLAFEVETGVVLEKMQCSMVMMKLLIHYCDSVHN